MVDDDVLILEDDALNFGVPHPKPAKRARVEIDLTGDWKGGGGFRKKAARRRRGAPAVVVGTGDGDDILDITGDVWKPVKAKAEAIVLIDDGSEDGGADTAVDHIVNLFPDCAINHIRSLLEQYSNDAELVISHLCEEGDSYPKAKTSGAKKGFVVALKGCPESATTTPLASKLIITQDVMARYCSLTKQAEEWKEAKGDVSENYLKQAEALLASSFPLLSLTSIRAVMNENRKRLFKTKQRLKELVYGEHAKPEVAAAQPITHAKIIGNIKAQGWRPLSKTRSPSTPSVASVETRDPELAKEEEFVKQYEAMEQEMLDRCKAELEAVKDAEERRENMECACCFGEMPFLCSVQCTEGHLYCYDCLRNFARTRLFDEMRSTLPCMSSGSEKCGGHFTDNQLIQVLEPKVYLKLTELEGSDAIKSIKGLHIYTCPYCSFPAEVDDQVRWFECPGCEKETCVQCKEDKHPEIPCSQVEKKGDTSVRKRVEEALTEAKVRRCPNCAKQGVETMFLKDTGCNKMTCTKCGALSCYLCRKHIERAVGYKHFCTTPLCKHESCGKCNLYSSPEEDDARAMREAGLRAKAEAQAEEANTNQDLDVDALMRAGAPPAASKARTHAPPAAHVAHAAAGAAGGRFGPLHAVGAFIGLYGVPPPPPPPVHMPLPPPPVPLMPAPPLPPARPAMGVAGGMRAANRRHRR